MAMASPVQDLDVLIVGAGISGIGAAVHLQQQCPGKTWAILESQDGFGGTWRTHRYPGIRSDSDLFTFGYRFKPWMGKPIATAAEILAYLGEVIDEHGLAPHIQYRHGIQSAAWDSTAKRWTVTATRPAADGAGSETVQVRARFLWMCQGYYRHGEGYTPSWPGMDRYQGRVVHPQTWPDDLDLTGKRVVVIGSGATAATLIPAIADRCAHVTMLQRSPTFFITGRNANELADTLRQLEIPDAWTHEIVRRKVLFDQANFIRRCQAEPEVVRQELLAGVRAALGPAHAHLVDQHFNPRYRPWQQRIAFVPDADLFKAVRSGQAAVVTDQIETFTSDGLQLQSGALLQADVVVTATGFHLNVLGDIQFSIDGRPLDFAQTVAWNGALFTGVPNLAWVFGYLRASWTLRADLMGDLVCRLLQQMDARGASVVQPVLRPQDADMARLPWITADNFSAGYMQRGVALLPQQGDRAPWLHTQDYASERHTLPQADLDDGSLQFL
ncbi:flavin-containing monooxygenase [Pseudaquabacterium pictum]|uniref:Cyclohexanone monooxygenase n=1 Tax=Pseudaquabacterium pictum TaxID=2315236 RepID=A0A480AMS9_9BURK|nr:cyclohexanone monooxygenase [Rubrivivax pictus]